MEEEAVDAQEPRPPSPGLAGPPSPSYCMLDLVNTGNSVHYAFMYNGKRFYVTISADKLRGKGALTQEFVRFTKSLDDLDGMFQFEDWVLGALNDFISKVAPAAPEAERRRSRTLQDFFGCPTFALELVNEGGRLCPVKRDLDFPLHADTSPRIHIIDSSTSNTKTAWMNSNGEGDTRGGEEVQVEGEEEEEEEGGEEGPDGRRIRSILDQREQIQLSALPKVPCILASELECIDDDGPVLTEFSDDPKKVRRIGTNQVFFFKGAFKSQMREMELLDQINQRSDKFVPPFRTSRLVGLVLWDHDDDNDSNHHHNNSSDNRGSSLMGFLLEYIDGRTLAASMADAHAELKMKWISEVEVTLRRLHECGIVWGAVKPENVIINADGEAVIVDLGDLHTPEYIEPEDRQTVRGDMLGLEHMRMELGLIDQSLYSATLSH